MTKGETWSLAILTAKEFGFESSYIGVAESYLSTKLVQPTLIAVLEKESIKAIEFVQSKKVEAEAIKVCGKIADKYNIGQDDDENN